MRHLRRPSVVPPTLTPTGLGGRETQRHLGRRRADASAVLSFPPHWNRTDVRGVLYSMQWRVCAYCSRSLPGNDRGDVEHFRPKNAVAEAPNHGGYWWLAYTLENYLVSCGVCNRARKGTRFPMRPRGRHVSFAERARLKREARLLWNPTDDPLDDWVDVDLDDDLLAVRPRAGLSKTQTRQIEASVGFFRINRDQFLVRERLEVLDRVSAAVAARDDDRARALAVRFSPQSAVACALLRRVAPELLPDATAEIDWLVDRILDELDRLLELDQRFCDDERSTIELDETFWCLATLLRDPGDGDRARIERVCTDHGILDRVQPLTAQL